MNVWKAINDLKAKKVNLLDQANAALEANDLDKATGFKDELQKLNDEIDKLTVLAQEMSRGSLTPLADQEAPGQAANNTKKIADILASSDYTRAFFAAMSNSETIRTARGKSEYGVLYAALTETGGNPVGSEGGFLLPVDFDKLIWELRRTYVSLADLLTVENVTTTSGWRVRQSSRAGAKLLPMTEMKKIGDAEAPTFIRIDYKIADHGGLIPVSNDLLDDAPMNLMNYLARWFAKLSLNTENAAIIALLNKLSGIPYDRSKGVASLKTALNMKLDPANSTRAKILTNQSGFDFLDQLVDAMGRPLLQPDVTNPTQHKVLGRQVIVMPNAQLPNTEDEEEETNTAPLYVGDFEEYGDFFRRMAFEMASTNVGAGAFESNTTMVRGIERFDVQRIDEESVVKLELPL